MENFNTIVQSAAQALSMGAPKAEVVATLTSKGLSPEQVFLAYQAATVFAKGAS